MQRTLVNGEGGGAIPSIKVQRLKVSIYHDIKVSNCPFRVLWDISRGTRIEILSDHFRSVRSVASDSSNSSAQSRDNKVNSEVFPQGMLSNRKEM